MARTRSDYKLCKSCFKSYKLAWHQTRAGWKLVKALEDGQGHVLRDATGKPLPELKPDGNPIYHQCGSDDGFGKSREDGKVEFGKEDFGFGGEKTPSPYPNEDDLQKAIEAGKVKIPVPAQPMPTPAKPGTEDAGLAAILALAVQPYIKQSLDSGEVRDIIAHEVEKIRKDVTKVEMVLVIEKHDSPEKTFDSPHPNLANLIKVVSSRKPDGGRLNAYLYGPPGSSKTTSARMVSEALSLPYSYISLNPQTADSRVSGFIDAGGVYRDTSFYRAYTGGGVFCIDEIDNASDNLLTALNSAIDNGHAAFPCGQVSRHPDFVLIATANTAGRGGDLNHAGRRPLDAATLERFVFMHWPYDEALEEKMTMDANPNAQGWLTWIRKVRDYASQNHPRLVVSPRASMTGAVLLKSGAFDSAAEIADSVLFKGLDKDTRAKILSACPLPPVKS